MAVFAYNQIRSTQDIDITLLTEIDKLKLLHDVIIDHFTPAFSDSLNFFQKNFVLPVLDKSTGIRIDFGAGLSGFDRNVIERSKRIQIGNIKINVCSIEDLIIYKLVASRSQDKVDVEELFKLHKDKIDKKYLLSTAREFVQLEREDILENLNKFI